MSHWISEERIKKEIEYHQQEAKKYQIGSEIYRCHIAAAETFREELEELRRKNSIDVKASGKDS